MALPGIHSRTLQDFNIQFPRLQDGILVFEPFLKVMLQNLGKLSTRHLGDDLVTASLSKSALVPLRYHQLEFYYA